MPSITSEGTPIGSVTLESPEHIALSMKGVSLALHVLDSTHGVDFVASVCKNGYDVALRFQQLKLPTFENLMLTSYCHFVAPAPALRET